MEKSPVIYPLQDRRIWVAGHGGLVGSALMRRLQREGCIILTATRQQLDLTQQPDVAAWVVDNRPQAIIVAAAKVGGIRANSTYPVDFLYQNLVIQNSIIHAAWQSGVEKLMMLGSSCIYPKFAPQPIPESALLTGPLEPTNEWYAVAKIAGIKMCQAFRQQYGSDFISVMPNNLYGPGDNFDPLNSHVLPALMVKFHDAVTTGQDWVEIWGTGTPRRELMYVDDLADACVFLMERYSDPEIINVGMGIDFTISEIAQTVARVVGFEGTLRYNTDKPDGTPRKILDVSRITAMGWSAQTDLVAGLQQMYAWYRENVAGLPPQEK